MARKTLSLLRNLIVLNGIIGGVIGAAFGVYRDSLLWLFGGVIAGALLGWLTEYLFRRFRATWLYPRRALILVFFQTLLVIYGVTPFFIGYQVTHPFRSPLIARPSDRGLSYEDVRLTASDGQPLAGWYIRSQNRAAVIVLHGSGGNRSDALDHATVLARNGYGVLLMDVRAHGESGDNRLSLARAGLDMNTAVEFLQKQSDLDLERIGGLGLSLGGMVMLEAAARNREIRAVISDGADAAALDDYMPLPPQYHYWTPLSPEVWMTERFTEFFGGTPSSSIKQAVQQIAPRPLLLISADEEIEQFLNTRYYELAGPTAELWALKGASHCAGLKVYPEEYSRRIISFYDKNLLGIPSAK